MDKVRACWQKSITWRSCLGGRLTIWLCGRVPINSSQRVGIGKSQTQSCRVRTRSLSSWGSTWVPGLRQSEMQAQAEEINKKAASLVLSFDSNTVKVGRHLSSHPGTGEKLDWSNPIESPQLSRYTACTCGRVWPYCRKGSATLKTLHSFPSFLWFLLCILATRCHGPKGLSVFSWICRDVEFWDMWLFKFCQGHAMPCHAMPCRARRVTDTGPWRVEYTVAEPRNLIQRSDGVSKAHSSFLCEWVVLIQQNYFHEFSNDQ